MLTIQAKKKDNQDNASVREAGFLPAVVYGSKKESTGIVVDLKEFSKVWAKAGESTMITLITPDGEIETLIHDVQIDPVKNIPIHADFLAVDSSKTISVHIPINFIGISAGAKNGVLVKILHELEIEALPKDIPHDIEVDLSKLSAIDDQIKIKDIKVPQGVKILNNEEDIVAAVTSQKEEKEEEGPVDLSAIEVEKKGKKEEEVIPAE